VVRAVQEPYSRALFIIAVTGRKAHAGVWRAYEVLTHHAEGAGLIEARLLSGEEYDDGWAAMDLVPSMCNPNGVIQDPPQLIFQPFPPTPGSS
jgi:hypothetical protein